MKVLSQGVIQRLPFKIYDAANVTLAGGMCIMPDASNGDWSVADNQAQYAIMCFSGSSRYDYEETEKVTGIFASEFLVELESGEYAPADNGNTGWTPAVDDPITICDAGASNAGYEGYITKYAVATDVYHGRVVDKVGTTLTVVFMAQGTDPDNEHA